MSGGTAGTLKLEVHLVSKDFAGVHALSGVSMQLEEGEILAVIGPNGSGKTTLINVISGVIRPSSGEVWVDGTLLSKLPSHKVARAGMARTFQNIRLFKDMTVLENVETAASQSTRSRGLIRARSVSRAALGLLGLDAHTDALVSTLPYGLQRRVEIARAIATQPRFLFLDEPAAGLNEAESDELLGLISSLRRQLGCGVLVVDHDMRLIMRVSKRIHVLNEGRTLVEGSPEEVRHNPAVIEAYLGVNYDAVDSAERSASQD
jgi:ABC-type branched-subunit amino acid transport system ATPase component